jgi:flagellar L-ring protein FlgH
MMPRCCGFLGTGLNLASNASNALDFQGTGESDQSNQLTGSITVTVANVLPNGLLEVRGEKWLQLNRGNEFIRINGLVRKEDISPDNTILSTRVADVRIVYSGTGTLADSNEAGWLTQFFVGNLWPF